MALIVADRVLETTTTTGTGALALAGAVTGFRDFDSVCANNDTCYYALWAINGSGNPTGDWETGLGTFTDTDTLTRSSVHASSNSNNAVNLAAGTKYVMLSATAEQFAKFTGAGLTDPNADRILFWDDSAAAVQHLSVAGNVAISGTTLTASESLVIACSDESTALAAGTGKITFRMPYAFTVTAVRASLTTAQTSGNIFTVYINESGTTILSTKLTIDNTEKTSTTAATPPVISDSALADDAEITVDIDQIGDGTAKGLKVYLIGNKT